ncbi:hypothetical protein [Arcicella lustrica]|uniref:Uncharacterized protein n=1 Tax=Arcicella lustrica TaxID=2984196 RepID=A0ABU5SHN7_9BACT|nr:hypothetical protein [Arcicella sp. DC25W]MEA5426802.1 hypothetical protein [Arcicella sp. DC25W]
MKNSFNAFCLLMLVGGFIMVGVYHSNGNQKPQKQSFDTVKAVQKVHEINDVVKTELLLDSTTFGVCDTCRSSFVSALQENRTLVDSVLDENLVLYDNWIATKSLNDSLLKVNKMVLLEINRSKAILKKR